MTQQRVLRDLTEADQDYYGPEFLAILAELIVANSFMRQYADDYPEEYITYVLHDYPESGFDIDNLGVISYSGPPSTITYSIFASGRLVEDHKTQGIGASPGGGDYVISRGFLADIGRMM